MYSGEGVRRANVVWSLRTHTAAELQRRVLYAYVHASCGVLREKRHGCRELGLRLYRVACGGEEHRYVVAVLWWRF